MASVKTSVEFQVKEDSEAGASYLTIKDNISAVVASTVEFDGHLDFDADGKLIGIEVLHPLGVAT